MTVFLEILNISWVFFFENILSRPAIFIGLIVLLGYSLTGKKPTEIFIGFMKTVVGYMILQVGSGGLVNNFSAILKGLSERFQLTATVTDPNFGFAAATKALSDIGAAGSATMLTLLIAFSWNILLVLFKPVTKVRTLFITGHIMVKQSAVTTWIIFLFFPELRGLYGTVATALLIGTYWAVFSNLTVEATQDLTDGAGFAVGHQQMLGVWFADKVAPFLGGKGKDKDIEHMNLPGALGLFNNYIAATCLMMFLFFGTLLFILGPEVMQKADPAFKGMSFGIYVFEKCIFFTVYLEILRLGVRLFVGEMIESFTGISNKLLKGSLPAVDCAATYAFAPGNAVLFGFIFGTLGQLFAIACLFIFKSPIFIIPGFVPLFFDNATIGVFANKKGGFRAVVIICILSGILQVFGSAFAAVFFGLSKYGGWVGNLDWATLWPVMGLLMKAFSLPGLIACIILMLLIPQIQYLRNKQSYFKPYKEGQ